MTQQTASISLFYFLLALAAYLGGSCRPLYAPATITETNNLMVTPSPLGADSVRIAKNYVSAGYAQGFRYLPEDFNQSFIAQYHRGILKPRNNENNNIFETIAIGVMAYGGNYVVRDRYFANWATLRGDYGFWGATARFAYNYKIRVSNSFYYSPFGYMGALGFETGEYGAFRKTAEESNRIRNILGNTIYNNAFTYGCGFKSKNGLQVDVHNSISAFFPIILSYNVNLDVSYKNFHSWAGIYTLGYNPSWRMGITYNW
jgi:hypothetical protein